MSPHSDRGWRHRGLAFLQENIHTQNYIIIIKIIITGIVFV